MYIHYTYPYMYNDMYIIIPNKPGTRWSLLGTSLRCGATMHPSPHTGRQRLSLLTLCCIVYKHMGMGQNPCTPGEPQNSWDLWMFIPLKMYL